MCQFIRRATKWTVTQILQSPPLQVVMSDFHEGILDILPWTEPKDGGRHDWTRLMKGQKLLSLSWKLSLIESFTFQRPWANCGAFRGILSLLQLLITYFDSSCWDKEAALLLQTVMIPDHQKSASLILLILFLGVDKNHEYCFWMHPHLICTYLLCCLL